MNLKRFLVLVLLGGALAACGTVPPSPTAPAPSLAENERLVMPISSPAVLGATYPLVLGTHCGLTEATIDFDGSLWLPVELPSIVQGHGTTAGRGFGNPTDAGTISLVGTDQAIYRTSEGVGISLARQPGSLGRPVCY